jgi:hypothetical protein
MPRRLRQRDLLLPAYHSGLKLFGACAACGVAISLLYAWTPLMIVAILFGDPIGHWTWAVVGGVAVLSTVVLFAIATRQMARYREVATSP